MKCLDPRLACLLLIATLLLPGCGEPQTSYASPYKKIRLAEDRFYIGVPEEYAEPGVYDDYYKSHGIYLVSDHNMLVALSAVSPDTDCTVRYDPSIDQFVDPSDRSRYTSDGLTMGDPQGRQALKRCRIVLSMNLSHDHRQILVDPQDLYHFEEKQWSDFNCMFDFDDADAPRFQPPASRGERPNP